MAFVDGTNKNINLQLTELGMKYLLDRDFDKFKIKYFSLSDYGVNYEADGPPILIEFNRGDGDGTVMGPNIKFEIETQI